MLIYFNTAAEIKEMLVLTLINSNFIEFTQNAAHNKY